MACGDTWDGMTGRAGGGFVVLVYLQDIDFELVMSFDRREIEVNLYDFANFP